MAALRQLFPYLEQGYTIRGGPNFTEKIVPSRKDGKLTFQRYKQLGPELWKEDDRADMTTVAAWYSTWEWGVIVRDALLTNLDEIQAAIASRLSS